MPGIELFGRRWNIGSDDLFYPCILEFVTRILWLSLQISFYLESRQTFSCSKPYIDLLHSYFISFLSIATLLALNTLLIALISTRGTITQSRPRRHIPSLIYMRLLLYALDVASSGIGLFLLIETNWSVCSKLIMASMIVNLVLCLVGVFILIIPAIILFDPISHLPERDIAKKRHILYQRVKRVFFCCTCCLYETPGSASRSLTYENSYKQISSLLEMIFRGGDLTPSDVLAGIILLSNKEIDQFKRERVIYAKQQRKRLSMQPPLADKDSEDETPPDWMNVNEASHYVRYAVACYSWPYYLYMNSIKGVNDLHCSASMLACCCCCCKQEESEATEETRNVAEAEVEAAVATAATIVHGLVHGDPSRNHMRAFKILASIDECDVVYANFNNDLFFVPFCILVDHTKKTVVIAIRGTLSMRDVITDITAEIGYFDVDEFREQPVHIGILNTADNILKKIQSFNILQDCFRRNPGYQLMVTGHSLGAGTAVILSLRLKKYYPNIKCIAYSPPGCLVSKELADYTKPFIMSVVVGDDIVPRLSIRAIHNLKADILKELYNCHMPKYKILWKYSISCFRSSTPLSNESRSASESSNSSIMLESDNEDKVVTSAPHLASAESAFDSSYNKEANLKHTLIAIDDDGEDLIESTDRPKKLLFKAAAQAVIDESRKRRRSARKNLLAQNNNGPSTSSSSSATEKPITTANNSNNSETKSIKSVQECVAAYQQQVKKMLHTVNTTYPDLQLPGNILYIYRIHNATFGNPNNHPISRRLCTQIVSCCYSMVTKSERPSAAEYDSRWAERDEFKKILITNRILMDHFPNTVENSLKYFSTNGAYVNSSSRSSTAAFLS